MPLTTHKNPLFYAVYMNHVILISAQISFALASLHSYDFVDGAYRIQAC